MSVKPRRLVVAACVPLVLAVVSWWLGGNEVWGWTAALGASVLLVSAVAGLRVADELRPGHFLLFGYLVVCWTVWTAIGVWLPLTTIRVEAGRGEEPDCPLRIYYGDTLITELDRPRSFSFSIRGKFHRRALTIETLTPLGWAGRPFDDYGDRVVLEGIPLALLYIDNRREGETVLTCGELRWQVAADSHEVRRIPAPEDGAVFPLTINGEPVGQVEGPDTLIDVAGVHAYQLRERVYADGLDRLIDPEGLQPRSDVRSYQGRHVHHLRERLDYFLSPAPSEVQVGTFAGIPTGPARRMELLDAPP